MRTVATKVTAAAALVGAALCAFLGLTVTAASAQQMEVKAAYLASAPVVVTGVIEQGAVAGCTVLRADTGQTFNLIGKAIFHPPGTRVRVTGDIAAGGSVCAQGSTIDVVSIQPLWT
jgi:Protein of unknown function (DUF5818)